MTYPLCHLTSSWLQNALAFLFSDIWFRAFLLLNELIAKLGMRDD
uniref:Uncharacterized protein n=1 Tax=Rhizophora mucronata TaxID=61149 RepID=A0A2P2JWR8_RHIMU